MILLMADKVLNVGYCSDYSLGGHYLSKATCLIWPHLFSTTELFV